MLIVDHEGWRVEQGGGGGGNSGSRMREEQGVGEVGCLGPLLDPTKGKRVILYGTVEQRKIEEMKEVSEVDGMVNF